MAMNDQECPVCGNEIGEDGETVNAQGKSVRVCCDSCAEKMRQNPSAYAQPAAAE